MEQRAQTQSQLDAPTLGDPWTNVAQTSYSFTTTDICMRQQKHKKKTTATLVDARCRMFLLYHIIHRAAFVYIFFDSQFKTGFLFFFLRLSTHIFEMLFFFFSTSSL